MRGCCVTNFINGFHRGIERSIIADGIISAENVIINGSRYADDLDTEFFAENIGTFKGSVTTDADHAINAVFPAIFKRFFASFVGFKFCGAGRFQDGTPFGNNMFHRARAHLNKAVRHQAVEAFTNAITIDFVVARRADHGAQRGIHARCITAGSKNYNLFDCTVFHRKKIQCEFTKYRSIKPCARQPSLFRLFSDKIP